MNRRVLAAAVWRRYSATFDRINRAAEFERWRAKQNAHACATRSALYTYVSNTLGLQDQPLNYLEFGVWYGSSLREWAGLARHPESRFWGFDSFEGLPEAWDGKPAGTFATKQPTFEDERIQLVPGLFQHTLPAFLPSWRRTGRLVVHLDADLYTSTLFVLTSLSPLLQSGDVLLFDEFNDLLHEWRAYDDWSRSFMVTCGSLAETNGFHQVAFVVGPGTR
jgi:hypothetical protein